MGALSTALARSRGDGRRGFAASGTSRLGCKKLRIETDRGLKILDSDVDVKTLHALFLLG